MSAARSDGRPYPPCAARISQVDMVKSANVLRVVREVETAAKRERRRREGEHMERNTRAKNGAARRRERRGRKRVSRATTNVAVRQRLIETTTGRERRYRNVRYHQAPATIDPRRFFATLHNRSD